ncbi:putative RNA-directed DNA polymerase [Helianthus annuus]|nr:putative RNA-directed DNA polymerase [Helianthus annuus]KAJ0687335.1 putative RNA-directed DNA polymerase [Helianthus annuus]
MIRRLNDIIRSLLIHAHLPPIFWVVALHTATYLHNILPTKCLNFFTPTFALYLRHPTYDHLRVFGSACYPNTSATQPHKLHPREIRCIFLGYPADFRGYRCLDPTTGRVHISRHVTFDEQTFPYSLHIPSTRYSFLEDPIPTGFTFGQTPSPKPDVTAPFTFNYSRRPRPTTTHPLTQPATSPAQPLPIPNDPPGPPTSADTQTAPTPSTATQTAHSTSAIPTPRPSSSNNIHPMSTRSKTGSIKLPLYPTLMTIPISPVPTTYAKAFADSNWVHAMQTEFNALQENETWELVPRPSDRSVIRFMWLFRHKFKADGSLERYKARLVVNGKSQTVGIDCDETFSPVVKPATIRTVLSLAVNRSWPIHQLDVKNAFLHGHLNETVFMHQPPGFVDTRRPNFVCRLKKSLYGLKQAPRAWYTRFASYILQKGFSNSACDNSLFIYSKGADTAYLLLYVDDIVLTAFSTALLNNIIQTLSREFAMTDLGALHYFLGIKVSRHSHGLFLSQSQYAKDILARASMTACKPCTTPVDLSAKLSATEGPLFADPTLYRSLAGALQYLNFTRPDISYAVQQVCLFMHEPREPHFAFMKSIFGYLQGTVDYGLRIMKCASNDLIAYSDTDWGGCPDSRRSTSGYCTFLGDNLISWSSKRQATISRSSAEAEYRGVANAVAEATWLRNLLFELHVPLQKATVVYCDNVSAVYLSDNPVQHQRTKHIEIDIHFVREKVRVGHIRVLHVPAANQYADIFTKGFPRDLFQSFRSSLSVCTPPAQTAGEY